MNKNVLKLAGIITLLFIGSSYANQVTLTNETQYPVKATIYYNGIFCSTDRDVDIAPGKTYRNEVGACLINQIAASVFVPGRAMPATARPYTSSGTGYRTFKIVSEYNGNYETFSVIRPN